MREIFPHPYTLDDAEKLIERVIGSKTIFCIEYAGECIGVIGAFRQSDVYIKNAELGYWLAEPFWSKGIMSEAVNTVCHYIFNNFDIIRIYASAYEWNPASMKLLEKCGFKREGISVKSVFKDGSLVNEHKYALIRPGLL